jgi:hypothetical protein
MVGRSGLNNLVIAVQKICSDRIAYGFNFRNPQDGSVAKTKCYSEKGHDKPIESLYGRKAFFLYVLSGTNSCQNVRTFHEKNADVFHFSQPSGIKTGHGVLNQDDLVVSLTGLVYGSSRTIRVITASKDKCRNIKAFHVGIQGGLVKGSPSWFVNDDLIC